MANQLLISMVNDDPFAAPEAGPQLFQVVVDAAMDYESEVISIPRAGALAVRGVAEKLSVKPGLTQRVHDFMRGDQGAGAKFGTATLERLGRDPTSEIDETVDGACIIEQAMRDHVATFTC